jgi:hypothetical protein
MCYIRFGAYPNCTHIKIIVKTTCGKKKRERKKENPAQIGTKVRARIFNARLLDRSQFASGRSCDRPTRSRFSVIFLGPGTNAELVPRFHIALHVSHAAFPMVTLKISLYTNVTLTLDFGLDHPFDGGYE